MAKRRRSLRRLAPVLRYDRDAILYRFVRSFQGFGMLESDDLEPSFGLAFGTTEIFEHSEIEGNDRRSLNYEEIS